ncbi:hypothetical protein ACFV9W_18490 [Streptomyces sp. NPDC059897]|uniref:hypothetical protein n=1 Tax=Streptomyces sp. NPDC059897 TaxID=3346994 RepID=UPI0036591960
MKLSEDKWQAVAIGWLAICTIDIAADCSGWARALWPALGLLAASAWGRERHVKRRKHRAGRQALLTRLDRLMRREVKRR